MFQQITVPVERPNVALYTDIVYTNYIDDIGCHNTPLKLNLIHAKNPFGPMEKLPCLVWAEGGAWRLSSPALRIPELCYYAYHGYAVANVQYAVSTEKSWPTPVENIQTAVRYLKTHADALGIDPEKICLAGESAGAHLVSVAALTGGTELFKTKEWSEADSRVQGCISWYGPGSIEVDLKKRGAFERSLFMVDPEGELVHADLLQHPEKIPPLDPMHYVTPDAPPFLFFHGDADNLIHASAGKALYDRLTENGVAADFYLIEGASHATVEFSQPAVQQRMLAFLDKQLKTEKER